jgi:hypothetical protein
MSVKTCDIACWPQAALGDVCSYIAVRISGRSANMPQITRMTHLGHVGSGFERPLCGLAERQLAEFCSGIDRAPGQAYLPICDAPWQIDH